MTNPIKVINEPTEVMKTILMSQLEHELVDIRLEMRRLEGIINSTSIKSQKFKDESKKKIEQLLKKRNSITDKITEVMLLGGDI